MSGDGAAEELLKRLRKVEALSDAITVGQLFVPDIATEPSHDPAAAGEWHSFVKMQVALGLIEADLPVHPGSLVYGLTDEGRQCIARFASFFDSPDASRPEMEQWKMTDSELILRAGLAAFSDADRVVAMNLDRFDPLNSRDDLVRLLLATGISFSRSSHTHISAEMGGDSVQVMIQSGDELAAAARAACELAASWIDDHEVQAWKIATGRFMRPHD